MQPLQVSLSGRKQRGSGRTNETAGTAGKGQCGRLQNGHKSPLPVRISAVQLQALLSRGEVYFSTSESVLGHNHCDTNKSLKNTCALGISLSCCAWNPETSVWKSLNLPTGRKRDHVEEEWSVPDNRLPSVSRVPEAIQGDPAPAKSLADQTHERVQQWSAE